jgi:hypothetical protein
LFSATACTTMWCRFKTIRSEPRLVCCQVVGFLT